MQWFPQISWFSFSNHQFLCFYLQFTYSFRIAAIIVVLFFPNPNGIPFQSGSLNFQSFLFRNPSRKRVLRLSYSFIRWEHSFHWVNLNSLFFILQAIRFDSITSLYFFLILSSVLWVTSFSWIKFVINLLSASTYFLSNLGIIH